MKLREKCQELARNYREMNKIDPRDEYKRLAERYEMYARSPEFLLKMMRKARIELSYASTTPLFETIKKLTGKIKEAPKPPPTKIRIERKPKEKKKRR